MVELHPDDGYASIVVGIMDVMGGMDGINEAGLTVALLADNETPEPEPTGAPRVGLSEQQVVRYLLDTCATIDEAESTLCASPSTTTSSRHAISSSPTARVDRSCGSTRRAERTAEVVGGAGPDCDPVGRLVCTNHLLHRWPDQKQLPDDSGPIGTVVLSPITGGVMLHPRRTPMAGVSLTATTSGSSSPRCGSPHRSMRHAPSGTAIYDVEEASVHVSFYVGDRDGRSLYSDSIRLALDTPQR